MDVDGALKAITANRLRDGAVVWLGNGNLWVERIEDAAVFAGADADAALTAAQRWERDNVVVAIYALEVGLSHGHAVPLRQRERIRAAGPSVRPDVGKQAAALDRAA